MTPILQILVLEYAGCTAAMYYLPWEHRCSLGNKKYMNTQSSSGYINLQLGWDVWFSREPENLKSELL